MKSQTKINSSINNKNKKIKKSNLNYKHLLLKSLSSSTNLTSTTTTTTTMLPIKKNNKKNINSYKKLNTNKNYIYDNIILSLKSLSFNIIKILIHFQQYTSLSVKDISNYLNASNESVSFVIKVLFILEIIEKDQQDDDHYIWKGFENQGFKDTIDYISNSKLNFVTNHFENHLNNYNNNEQQTSNNNNNNNNYNKDLGSILHQFIKILIKSDKVSFLDIKNNIYLIGSQYYHIINIAKVLSVLGLISIDTTNKQDQVESVYFKWLPFKPSTSTIL